MTLSDFLSPRFCPLLYDAGVENLYTMQVCVAPCAVFFMLSREAEQEKL